ncbi:hypothetical protein EBX93_10470, partial [bacterium]|nr:hypothetical protein [bacterium]
EYYCICNGDSEYYCICNGDSEYYCITIRYTTSNANKNNYTDTNKNTYSNTSGFLVDYRLRWKNILC